MIEFMDNFSIYGGNTALMLNGLYAGLQGSALVADPAAGTPGTVLRCQFDGINNAQQSWRRVLSSGQVTCGVAFRLWLPGLPANNNAKTRDIEFLDLANNRLAALIVNSTGALRVDITGGASYVSPSPNITANAWWHIEMKYTHGAGALCSFEVRVEGQTVLLQEDVAGTNANIGQVAQGRDNISGDGASYMKDFVIWNGAGARNNNFIGSVIVYSLTPNADIALNWTPSVGADGFSILDNAPPNDAQYILAGTPPPAAYVAGLTNLPINVTSIRGIMTVTRATKTDGGDASLQTGLVSAGVTVNGSDRPITITPTWWTDIFETDPATAAPFSPAAVDLLNMKINRTT